MLTVQHGAELVQIAVNSGELYWDLVYGIHEVLDDEDVVGVIENGRRWRW